VTAPLAEWFGTDIDLRKNQLINAAAHNSAVAPDSPVKGQLWFDTSTTPGSLKYWDGTTWTGGRTYYNTIADEGVAKPQRTRLDFRSTASMSVDVADVAGSDSSAVTVDAKFGAVTPSTVSSALPANGVASTLARSDHVHGTPPVSGADLALTTWWESDKNNWDVYTAPGTFLADLPGQTVGGGWQLGTNGTIYWAGSPLPIGDGATYRNEARVSAVGSSATMSMGWLCYDADKALLGEAVCTNHVDIVPAKETGLLVERNECVNGSVEGGVVGISDDNWHSNSIFGSGALATVSYSTDRAHHGTRSVKAVWPNLGSGNTQSNVISRAPNAFPPNTQLTFSAWFYVPTGNPNVRMDIVFWASGPVVTERDQWVYKELRWTTPNDDTNHVYFMGMTADAPVAGTVAYMDQVMFRVGWDPIPGGVTYFDGDTPSTTTQVFVWDGKPYASPSSYYTIEPSWESVEGFIAYGDGTQPAVNTSADVAHAVGPLQNSVFYRPFVRSDAGSLLIDTHSVVRGSRELNVADGISTGWLDSTGEITGGSLKTSDVAPLDAADPAARVPIRVGPVLDPPRQASDVAPKAYVDRSVGAVPPQFLYAGYGNDPTPADLGFPFAAWPLFSTWLNPSVQQGRATVAMGSSSGNNYVNAPLAANFSPLPGSYFVTIIPPADGVILAMSSGAFNGPYNDWVNLRCGITSGVDWNGVGGTDVTVGTVALSPGDAALPTNNLIGNYCVFSAANAVANTRYRIGTQYAHGGPGASTVYDRSVALFIPGGVRLGASA
jgi:hypothetical protein